MQISAVIVTRGDVDLGPCLAALRQFDEIIIRRGDDRALFARYEGALDAKNEVIYTQDDDCVVDAAAVVAAYDPQRVTCNMPIPKRAEYPDGIALVGWGAVFNAAAVSKAFGHYGLLFGRDDLFLVEADRVFTGLSECKLIDVLFSHCPHAFGPDRLGARSNHLARLAAIRERIYAARNHHA